MSTATNTTSHWYSCASHMGPEGYKKACSVPPQHAMITNCQHPSYPEYNALKALAMRVNSCRGGSATTTPIRLHTLMYTTPQCTKVLPDRNKPYQYLRREPPKNPSTQPYHTAIPRSTQMCKHAQSPLPTLPKPRPSGQRAEITEWLCPSRRWTWSAVSHRCTGKHRLNNNAARRGWIHREHDDGESHTIGHKPQGPHMSIQHDTKASMPLAIRGSSERSTTYQRT